ncbi:MAG: hypothetical protein KDC44_12260, partial [Phaeodactylibacter sp.]|nr:hypothetical protein [Phaeodactylibacter sp.]
IVEIDTIPPACVSTVINPTFSVLNDCYAAPDSVIWCFPGSLNPDLDTIVLYSDFDNLPAIAYDTVGTYEVIVKVYNECGIAIDTEILNVYPLPEIPTIAVNDPVCTGEALCFEVTGLGTNEIIEWHGPQGWTSSEISVCIPDVTVIDDGIYQLYILDTLTNCLNDTLIDVTVYALPPVNILPNTVNICDGQSTTLQAVGADSYQWFPPLGLDMTTGSMVTATPTDTMLYYVIGTDMATGCQNIDSVLVYVDTLPVVSAGQDTTACAGVDLQLFGSPAGGYFTGPNVTLGGLYNGPAGVDILTYHYADGQSCEDSATVVVCVQHIPVAGFDVDTMSGCGPLLVNLTNTSNTLDDCEAADYRWTVSFEG